MIPLIDRATYKGLKVKDLVSKEVADKIVADTMVGGATLTKLLGTSAWYAPGAAAATMVKAMVLDQKKVFPCCVALDGEYGKKDICIGVPAVIGKNGVEKVIELKLSAEEKEAFEKSAEAVNKTNSVLKEMGLVKCVATGASRQLREVSLRHRKSRRHGRSSIYLRAERS